MQTPGVLQWFFMYICTGKLKTEYWLTFILVFIVITLISAKIKLLRSSLIWVCTVCTRMTIPIFKVVWIHNYSQTCLKRSPKERTKWLLKTDDPSRQVHLHCILGQGT